MLSSPSVYPRLYSSPWSNPFHRSSLAVQTYDDVSDDIAYGRLFLNIFQGSYSRTVVDEINPLDIGTFLGNVGGFWGT